MDLRKYLATKETKDKIADLVKQFALCSSSYDKKNHLYLEACGTDLNLFYDRKKGGVRKLSLSNEEFMATWQKRKEEYNNKIEGSKDKAVQERTKAHKEHFVAFMKKFHPLLNDKIAPKIPEPRGINPEFKVEDPLAAPVVPPV